MQEKPQESFDPGKLTIGAIVRNLSAAQMWSVVGAMLAAIAGLLAAGAFAQAHGWTSTTPPVHSGEVLVPSQASSAASIADAAASASVKPAADATAPWTITNVGIDSPRGNKAMVLWEPNPGPVAEKDLRAHNIDVDQVRGGILQIYSALMKQPSGACEAMNWPNELGFNGEKIERPFPGLLYVFSGCDEPGDKRYRAFDLFQGTEFAKIYFESPTEGKRIAPIGLQSIGIDWARVRQGFKQTLSALYGGKYDVRVDDKIDMYTAADGSWGYNLPIRAVPLEHSE